MQILIIAVMLYQIWNVRKHLRVLLGSIAVSLCLLLLVLYVDQPYVSGGVILLYLYVAQKTDYLALFTMVIIMLLTYTLEYYLLVWVMLEIMFVSHGRLLRKDYEGQLQEYQNKVFDRQVREVEHMFVLMRGWRHDYHHHLQNLKVKLKREEITASILYLDELEQELKDIKQLVESGNTNMDAILNAKLSLAVNQGIDVHVKAKVPEHISMSDTDSCALLGNLVDNALEACYQVSTEAFLRFYIGQYKGQLYISCTNSTNEVVRKLDEEYITTKRGNHGHGMKRMNLIVEKYGGSIIRKNEPGVFTTEILLPL